MKRILLKIAYDGSSYKGWQKQEGLDTIQGTIEKALYLAFKKEIEIFASGRTDAGVHAIEQCAHFDIDDSVPVKKIKNILNRILPDDIEIKSAKIVSNDFHARFSVKKKKYLYKIATSCKNCFLAKRVGFVKEKLYVTKMQECAFLFLGKHNFKGFCSSQTSAKDFEKTIYNILVLKKKNFIEVEVEGSGFLMHMVRILVGTMVDYALGKITKEDIVCALKTQDRSFAGQTMPPQGLYLKKVFY